ncbi:MAG: hypothetical protein ABUK01_13675 [Leptospirales bacterium]
MNFIKKPAMILLLSGMVALFTTNNFYAIKSQNYSRTQSWSSDLDGIKIEIELTYGGPNHLTPVLATVKKNGKTVRTFRKVEDFSDQG